MNTEDLVYRLRKRAEIRRSISSRKSVQEGKPDRLADLLDEAADSLEESRRRLEKAARALLATTPACNVPGYTLARAELEAALAELNDET